MSTTTQSPPGRLARLLTKAPDAHGERYTASVVTTNSAQSALLGNRRGRSIATSIGAKIASIIAVLMMVIAGFVGTVSSAQPAQADMAKDLVDAICMGQGSSGYAAFNKTFQAPTTGDGSDAAATPYEKYGMSGTDWSLWVGFEPRLDGHINANDFEGKGRSKGIVNLIENQGNDANLSQWEKQYDDAGTTNFPGMFNTTNECASFNARAWPNTIGNILLSVTKFIVWISGYTYQAAADLSNSIYTLMEGPVETIVQTMKDKLYFAYLTPMIMVSALWMAYIGLVKKQATVAFGGIIWVIAAVIASVIFMTKPMLLPQTMHSVVGTISQGGMAAITSYTHENGEGLCVVRPHAGGNTPDGKERGTESNATTAVRAVQCNLWYSFVYTPWVMGQFGETPTALTQAEKSKGLSNHSEAAKKTYVNNGFQNRVANDPSYVFKGPKVNLMVLTTEAVNNDQVGGKNGKGLLLQKVMIGSKAAPDSEQNWGLYLLDHRSNHDGAAPDQLVNKKRAQVMVTANQLSADHYSSDFRGDDGGNRVAVGLMAMVSSIAAGVMIVSISVSLIVMDLGVIVLALVSPLFFLAALHPGAGRRMAMGWLETMVKLGLKRIALSIFLAIMIAIFGVMISASMETGWAMAMIMIVALAAAGGTYQKQISEMFSGFSFGGQAMQEQNVAGRAAENGWQKMKGGLVGGMGAAREATKGGGGEGLTNAAKRIRKVTQGGAGPKPNDSDSRTKQASETFNSSRSEGAGDKPETNLPKGDPIVPGGKSESSMPRDTSGAGEAPQTEAYDQHVLGEQAKHEAEEQEAVDSSGSGPAPEIPITEYQRDDAEFEKSRDQQVARVAERDEAAAAAIEKRKVDRERERAETKRIKQSLKDNGHKGRAVGLGTVMAATAKGAVVGGWKGSPQAGVAAARGTIEGKRARVDAANEGAVKRTMASELETNREHERRAKELEKAKAKELADKQRAEKAKELELQRAKAKAEKSKPAGGSGSGSAPKPVGGSGSGAAPKPVGGSAPQPKSAPKPVDGSAPKTSEAAKKAAEGMKEGTSGAAPKPSGRRAASGQAAPPLPQPRAVKPKAAPQIAPAPSRPEN